MNKKETETDERKDAAEATKKKHEAVLKKLHFDEYGSFELAYIGYKIPIPDVPIPDVWDPTRFDFIKEDSPAPYTVNPSLWRQCKLTKIGGLFEVVPGIYQVRNYDIANMTIIESDSGIIIVDVLLCAETAKAALELYYDWKKEIKPVKAVIFTHSHIDHFGGVINGVTTMGDIEKGNVKVYAPHGFLNASYMENFYMGNVMGRRASYMYGNLLPADEKGEVGAGLGTTMATGAATLVPQNLINSIELTFEEKVIDGLTFEFQLTPGTEAPAEMNFFVPQYNALCTAENAVHTMHNVYSLRGAQIRDALSWSKDLNTALNRWGDGAKVYFGVHHWPVWGNRNVITYLKRQRDLYRYINDQTLRLANLGYKPVEIAEKLRELPPALENDWDIRGYYGSLNHNVKSVYVKHIGWFDGNPATLHTYPPCEAGKKYVEFMGGGEELMEKALASYQEGDYRWVVEVMNHLIFADPDHPAARKLQADALEQLGYQAESGPWRNFYLSGAQELRHGVKVIDKIPPHESFILSVPIDIFLDYMGMLLKGKEVWDEQAVIYIILEVDEETNEMEKYQLDMENGVLNHTNLNFVKGSPPDLEIQTTRKVFYDLIVGIAHGIISNPVEVLQELIQQGLIKYKGDITKFECILAHLQTLDPNFNIVEPIKPGDD
jgi:alkyl sulfatase BDS1-like metallo-beta-lactamase superfamily hydrolase